MLSKRVELLKLRLRIAMYKINTNQTLVPFSNLQLPNQRPIDAYSEPLDEQDEEILYQSSPERRTRLDPVAQPASPHSDHASPDAPRNIIITNGPLPKLLPGPVLLPTAYSTRFIEEQQVPASARKHPPAGEFRTPATSPRKDDAVVDHDSERDLTSSVVKGHAANGLLELMHAK